MKFKPNYLMMTAGPTNISGNVLHSRSNFFGNPDLDLDFKKYYSFLTTRLKTIFNTEEAQVIIMSGEGMLGLDSACASLTEEGDKVLIISNGIFGEGFKNLVEIYGGDVTVFESDWKEKISLQRLEEFLNKNSNFKYATVVHCDTPTGVLNDIEGICKLLKAKGILTVVDAVASIGGVEFNMDNWGVDIALGASQKVFSSAPGLTIMAVSKKAWEIIENRKTPIKSFYCNLLLWKNVDKKDNFPYTMPSSDIISLGTAIENLLSEPNFITFDRHLEMRDLCIKRLKELECRLFLKDGFSPTVTAFYPPNDINATDLLNHLKDRYSILLSGSYGELAGKILRIGHMGENAREDRIRYTLDCLKKAIDDLRNK